MHYINIANGYLIRRLQVWKAKHWRNWIYWAFPNHFAQGPWPCHMLGGCRSSLETSVQHDGWHARADTLGHLIFLSEFFGRTILVEIHPFKKKNPKKTTQLQYKCGACFPLIMLQSCEGLDQGKRWGFAERDAAPQSVPCGNLLKRSTDGWEGNLNVISGGLWLDP